MCASHVQQGGDGGDAAVQLADEVRADVGEDQLGGGEGFGAVFGF